MRFANASRTAGRDAMRERHRRDRTAAPTMGVRYPKLTTLQIDFSFSDMTEFLPSPQATVFHPPAAAYFCFACPYSDCDGEFTLTEAVELAVSAGDARVSGRAQCAGTRHRGVACTLCLEYTISPR